MPSKIPPMRRDIIRNRLERMLQLRNMNPNGAFHDLTLLDAMLDDAAELLSEVTDLESRLNTAVQRAVSHANLMESL